MTQNIIQAFQQAPWRVQMQKVGLILSVLAIVALIAGIYLSITASTYSAGVTVQTYEANIADMKKEIENLKTTYAANSSDIVMGKRAQDLGFQTPDPASFVYVIVPGYHGRQLNILKALPATPDQPVLIRPEYKRSLWEWMFQGALALSESAGGFQK
jgi:cell division protein FtsL